MLSNSTTVWNVIIIGAGNLGSRHAQSVVGCDHPVHLSLVDPSQASLARAKEILSATAHAQLVGVDYHTDFSDISDSYDVAVIATSSKVRKDAFFSLIERTKIRFCIFEKVLFPELNAYDQVHKALKELHISAWVNCPMRMYPGWQTILEQLHGYKGEYRLQTVGGLWGMACNTIHYIDMLSLLTDDKDTFTFNTAGISGVIPSKRTGYIDFVGTLLIQSEHCMASIVSSEHTTALPALDLYTDIAHYHIEEYAHAAFRSTEESGWKFEPQEFPIFYQSQLTASVVASLMDTGDCVLTPYERSAALHKPYLTAFLQSYQTITGKDESLCPIT